ncbi:MAG: ferrous iron transport protein A [Clostridiales bacterium]|nr:ferrous iron transport protein A [Clostridiales bacterium]
MKPLTLAKIDEENIILKIGGDHETKRHLEDLGFVVGTSVKVISDLYQGDLIVCIKDARVAINREIAAEIMI